ncbi:MAG: hypothetical protein GY772_08855 [bacterium]|nr:hypothetical protein [bacterium]
MHHLAQTPAAVGVTLAVAGVNSNGAKSARFGGCWSRGHAGGGGRCFGAPAVAPRWSRDGAVATGLAFRAPPFEGVPGRGRRRRRSAAGRMGRH